MDAAAVVLAAILEAAGAKHPAPLQKQFVCSGPMPESHYGHDQPQAGAEKKSGSITIRLDVAARRFAITQASEAFGPMCNVWVVCDGAERSIHEVKSNTYVLVKVSIRTRRSLAMSSCHSIA
jgi:hypothetical protein